MAGIFHLVIANKYLDCFGPEQIKAEKADGALTVAKARFKAYDKEGGSLAHFKLFASPVDASAYVESLKQIQNQASDYKKSGSTLAGAPEDWVKKRIDALKTEKVKAIVAKTEDKKGKKERKKDEPK